jgi:hypothetical protein
MARPAPHDHEPGAGGEPPPGGTDRLVDRNITRRTVLRSGSIGAAAAGLLAAVPGLSGLIGGASSAAPELSGAASGEAAGVAAADTSAVTGPIVAHITDAATGDISLYVGEREIPYRDPALVAHLLHAAR